MNRQLLLFKVVCFFLALLSIFRALSNMEMLDAITFQYRKLSLREIQHFKRNAAIARCELGKRARQSL